MQPQDKAEGFMIHDQNHWQNFTKQTVGFSTVLTIAKCSD
jgi:hypothetical protein